MRGFLYYMYGFFDLSDSFCNYARKYYNTSKCLLLESFSIHFLPRTAAPDYLFLPSPS